MCGSDVGTVRHVTTDALVIGCNDRSVAVDVNVTTRRCRQVMIGAERPVHHKGQRRHDRQTGREPSEQR